MIHLKICNIILAAAAIASTSCSRHDNGATILAVSIPPQATMLRELTGDSLTIVTAVKSEMNPESFEPATADFAALGRAKVFFTTGQFPFEKTIAQSIGNNVRIVNSGQGIDLLYGTHEECSHNHASHPSGNNAADPHSHVADPHIWTSVTNAKIIARNMARSLMEIDPGFADKYNRNLMKMEQRLDSLDNELAQKISSSSRKSFLVWHPSLSYFANDYGLEQIALGAENKETSVNQMRQQIDHASEAQVSAIFIQSSYDSRQASNIASQLHLSPTPINAMDADWEGQLSRIADIISRN